MQRLLAAALLLTGATTTDGNWRQPALVQVVGRGVVQVLPDLAVAVLVVEAHAADAAAAQGRLNRTVGRLMDLSAPFMLFPEQIETGFMNLDTVRAPLGGEAVSYTARKMVVFTLYDPRALEELLVKAFERGATRVHEIRFAANDPAALARRARDLALTDAREQAASLAFALGATAGRPWSVSQGRLEWRAPVVGWDFSALDFPQEPDTYARLDPFPRSRGAPTPLAPGRITVAVEIAAAFLLE